MPAAFVFGGSPAGATFGGASAFGAGVCAHIHTHTHETQITRGLFSVLFVSRNRINGLNVKVLQLYTSILDYV